ncbi:GEVED domain-containing protein [Brumimicrobium mesophilum]|uniref:GEVED domain-containing protein n=1 Tax=Brumimicrobium mesophilum TaxID=392717 RepID=UPI000D13EFD0|nr:GEVED domain-containing protein [Brumimicrobium mesophilum]
MKKKLLKGVLLFATFAFGVNLNAQCPIIPNDPIANPSVFNYCTGSTSAMITAETTTGGPASLSTNNQTGGNGCGGGAMFDITNTSAYDITVNTIDARFNGAGASTVVYTKSGTFLGSETTMANWTLLGNYTTVGGANTFENIDVADFVIAAGATMGIYINYNASYTTLTGPSVATNGEITITSGSGLCSAFGGVNANRGFNGTVNYTSAVPTGAIWYDAATGGNVLGTTNPFETVGTTVMPTATAGSYDFYVSSGVAGCESVNRTLVTVTIDPVNVEIDSIDVTCNNGNDGSFVVTNVACGTAPFTFSVDGGAFGPIPTNLLVGNHDVIVKDANGDESATYVVQVADALAPSALNASNITATTAELSWTANGSETSWNVEWGAPGFTPGTGTSIGSGLATTNPYSITITPATEYEFYVQAECGSINPGAWSGPYYFDNEYCDFTITSTNPQHITSFVTNGAIVNINNPASGPGTPNAGYTDFTTISMDAYETQIIDFDIAASTTFTYGASIYVDWNNDFVFDASEKVYASAGYQSMPQSGSFTIPTGIAVGQYRMRVVADYLNTAPPACTGNSAEAEDYTINIINPPSCLPPVDLDSVNVTTTSVELQWTSLSGATNWIIEYGLEGFTQGSGMEVNATTNPFIVTGLTPSANYDFYVRSDCGGGDSSAWRGPFSTYTDCGIAVAPYYEGFNNAVQPQCWENESSLTSTSVNNYWKFTGTPGYGATANGRTPGEYAWADGSSPYPDSMVLVTPEVDISQLATPYLSFEWFSNNTNTPGFNVPLIIWVHDGTNWNLLDTLRGDNPEWQFVNYDLSAYSNNIVKVAFVTNNAIVTTLQSQYNDILLDEIRIADCISLGGVDGVFDVCRLDSTVDLNDNIITKPNGGGDWSFPSQPTFLTQDSIFNVTFLPDGTYELFYVERFVCYDTTFATINVFNPSSAGIDGSDVVCLNEPLDLFGALGGAVDLGGQWFDFTNTLLPNSQPKAQPIPGNYNYFYVADNGVCPADTSIVTITVDNACDFLSLDNELFTDISVFPNPATSQLNIVNPSNTTSLKVEMLDMNGRVVLVEDKALNNASNATIAIDHLERGIYSLRVYNNEGQKSFKIVKQ